MSLDDTVIQTPEGPMTWAEWKKKNPVQIPSRRTKGKDLPVKVKKFTEAKPSGATSPKTIPTRKK